MINKSVSLLLLIFLIIRIVFVFFIFYKGLDPSMEGDGLGYHNYALALRENIVWDLKPEFYGSERPPFYPAFLAVIYYFFGTGNFLAVYILQSFLGTLLCFFIYKLSLEIFADKNASMLALLWSGFYFFYIKFSGMILRETLVFFLVIILFYYFYLYLKQNQFFHLFLCSLLFGILIHTDERYIIFLPVIFILLCLYSDFIKGLKRFLYFAVICLVLILPWSMRNYVSYKGIVLLSTKYFDFRKDKPARKELEKQTGSFKELNYSIFNNVITEEERKEIKKGLNPGNRSLKEINLVKQDIYPAKTYMERRLFMLREFFRITNFKGDFLPYPRGDFNCWSLTHNIINIILYGPLVLFLFVNIIEVFICRKNFKVLIFLTAPVIMSAIFHTLVWSRERYRTPLDALLIIAATFTMTNSIPLIINSLKRKNTPV